MSQLIIPPARGPSKPLFPDAFIDRILYTQQDLARRVQELGRQITEDYAPVGRDLVTFGILKGVLPFQADLLRAIDLPLRADVMTITGYKPALQHATEARPPGAVRITKDLDVSVVERHVLIIEDMVDTGLTLNFIIKMIRQRRPASLAVVTLFNREATRLAPNIPVRYTGFEAPADFLVGYGLDYKEQYRQLPYVAVLKPEALV
ncbi:MAG TPA: hypoxanthine phosphoribosyltransferase [Chloroflexia bacterium]|nr:hypoxanthine phosphoribosyltransferase [Chloroflexia bacterium]